MRQFLAYEHNSDHFSDQSQTSVSPKFSHFGVMIGRTINSFFFLYFIYSFAVFHFYVIDPGTTTIQKSHLHIALVRLQSQSA